ncbi:M66 family metalloprotease [Providencia huaxiensis]|uniref:M66 family metalloprotease n=1 Tax=Providencia huaxiensis TaxID=2027290 RepID=UPI0032DA10DB
MLNKHLSPASPLLFINSLNNHTPSIKDNYSFTDTKNEFNSIIDYFHLISEINKSFDNLSFLQNEKTKHYFNNNRHTSDVKGELKGNVFFAQANILPAKIHIEGDCKPKLVKERKTLIMFKPHAYIPEANDIQLNIYDKNNYLIMNKPLSPPSKLPKVANNSIRETNLSSHDFKSSVKFDLIIRSNSELIEISKNQKHLHETILNNNKINLKLNHNSIEKPFILHNNISYKGKTIALHNTNNNEVEVNYGNNTLTLPAKSATRFICDENGYWLTKNDVKKIKYYSPPKKAHPNTLPVIDFEIGNLPDIDREKIDAEFFEDILEKNSTIKITKMDYDRIKKFTLSQNKNFASKKIIFTSEAEESTFIQTKNKVYELKKDGLLLFHCDLNGVWKNISITDNKSRINNSHPSKFAITLDENKAIIEISKNQKHFNQLIKNNNSMKISTSDGNWSHDFTLDKNDAFHNKKILFSSNASYSSYIHYGKNTLQLQTGESILFVYDLDKKWVPINQNSKESFINNLEYIENTWSTTVPKEYIHPEIKLEFIYQGQKSMLSHIDVGAPNELLINTFDIGLLTPPRDTLLFLDKFELNRQYYQTIPVKKLIVSRYEPIHLLKVVMPDGQVFTDKAPDEGGGHSGSMRESITKDFYANGVNMANYGVNSSAPDADSFVPTSQITAYNSVGMYKNGRVVHGWSGGGGKATLNRTDNNELSHEFGHNFGLSDYYGGDEGGSHTTANKKNSTWLWDSDNNYFIPNTYQDGTLNHDAMSGGEAYDTRYNAYTAYTPNSFIAIQNRLENNYIFSPESKTGYKKWDPKTKEMVDAYLELSQFNATEFTAINGSDITINGLNSLLRKNNNVIIYNGNGYHAPKINIPLADKNNRNSVLRIQSSADWDSEIHINNQIESIKKNDSICYISDGYTWNRNDNNKTILYKVPYKQGVPVVTLMGFYDPKKVIDSYIYPSLYGSYGMVYNCDKEINTRIPYLEVILENGTTSQYQLHNFRSNEDMMNKFHINIERSLNPIKANLYIDNKIVHSREIEIKKNRLLTTINGEIA